MECGQAPTLVKDKQQHPTRISWSQHQTTSRSCHRVSLRANDAPEERHSISNVGEAQLISKVGGAADFPCWRKQLNSGSDVSTKPSHLRTNYLRFLTTRNTTNTDAISSDIERYTRKPLLACNLQCERNWYWILKRTSVDTEIRATYSVYSSPHPRPTC